MVFGRFCDMVLKIHKIKIGGSLKPKINEIFVFGG